MTDKTADQAQHHEFVLRLSGRTHALLLSAIGKVAGPEGAPLAEVITLVTLVTRQVASGNEVLIRPENGTHAHRVELVLLTDGVRTPETGT